MASTSEKPEDTKKDEDDPVNWPKGRLVIKRLPKFGSNFNARRVFNDSE